MNFDFTEEQLMIQQAAKDYAERELIKDVIERDEKAIFPTEHIKNLAELVLLSLTYIFFHIFYTQVYS